MLAVASIIAGTAVGAGFTMFGLRMVLRILDPQRGVTSSVDPLN